MIGRRSQDPDALLEVGSRVVVMTWSLETYAGVVVAGPRPPAGQRLFQSWLVRRRGSTASRWVSVISIVSAFPAPRLPRDAG